MERLAIHGGTPVRKTPINYGHQWIGKEDIDAVVQVLRSDYLTCGPEIAALEEELCKVTGARYATAVSNGTAALHAACYAAGIGKEDEVITTPLTFAASSNCILYMGGRPVFADVNPDTYNISPKSVEQHISKRTKAIIAVDFTGQAAELDEFRSLCEEYHLLLIEDGAHSIGTTYRNQPIGSIADLTTFSFHPVKTVTGGEGGAILTDDKELYKMLTLFRSHGITRDNAWMDFETEWKEERQDLGDWYYQQIALGYNCRMTDIQAALITSQLHKLAQFKLRRQDIVEQYNKAFADFPGIILQKEIPESNTARHLYLIQLELERLTVGRKEIFDALKAENVCCNVHYIPVDRKSVV